MNTEALALDQSLRAWYLEGRTDETASALIARRSLGVHPSALLPFARALRLLDTLHVPASIQTRVEELRLRLDALRLRERQVDTLGDLQTEPQYAFDLLGDDLARLEGFDLEGLRRSRLAHQESRARAARALLDALGWGGLPAETADALRSAIDDLEEREGFEAWGLFVADSAGEGHALGLKVALRPAGREDLWPEADQQVLEQARMARQLALGDGGWEVRLEWPASYAGESIGLPLFVAALVASQSLPRHALTASTGRLDLGGAVTPVTGIKEKMAAARLLGMRRVLVPRENADEARAHSGTDLLVVPVSHTNDVKAAFRQDLSSTALGFAGLIRLVRASIPDYGLLLRDEKSNPNGHRLMVADVRANASIWVYQNGRVHADGESSALASARRLIEERIPPEPEPRKNLTFLLATPTLQQRCHDALQDAGAVDAPVNEHERWRLVVARGRSRVTIVLYSTGKCVLAGTAPAWELAHEVIDGCTQSIGGLPGSSTPSPQTASPSEAIDENAPHIGTDEAGKGDYFGPLVSAAVYVDATSAKRLRELGVRDSKTLSDRRVRELAGQIREVAEGDYAVTPISPRKYNELYEQFRREGKNLNSLLAWGHGRSIENLLTRPAASRRPAGYVIVDQFADKRYIEERTHRAGIPVLQRHRAEADIAVAAASVLARDTFLQWLERWSDRTRVPLPKGASPQVVEAGKLFVRQWGTRWLSEVAKISFRTTRQVIADEDTHVDRRPPWATEPND